MPESTTTQSVVASSIVDVPPVSDMSDSVKAVEKLLDYKFKNKKLIEDALTHPSYTASASYQRLECLGDIALSLIVSSYVFCAYPDADAGEISVLRSANVSTEKLARVAVRHGLYRYLRHNAISLDKQVKDFVMAVEQEDGEEVHGGIMKAPKVLADIVESVVAAVYVDCGMNVEKLWMSFRGLLEPFITLDLLQQQPQPVTLLFELCQKEQKHVHIEHWRNGERTIASVHIDGVFLASASSKQKENAKLNVAKIALQKLSRKSNSKNDMYLLESRSRCDEIEDDKLCDRKRLKMETAGGIVSKKSMDTLDKQSRQANEMECPKKTLHELCDRKRWPRPIYKIEKQTGPAHERKFLCSVQVWIVESVLLMHGEEKLRVKDAESSAASAMLQALQHSNYT